MVTSGVSGGLTVAFLAVLDPGDEILIPDPYFPLYPQLATLLGAKACRLRHLPGLQRSMSRSSPSWSPTGPVPSSSTARATRPDTRCPRTKPGPSQVRRRTRPPHHQRRDLRGLRLRGTARQSAGVHPQLHRAQRRVQEHGDAGLARRLDARSQGPDRALPRRAAVHVRLCPGAGAVGRTRRSGPGLHAIRDSYRAKRDLIYCRAARDVPDATVGWLDLRVPTLPGGCDNRIGFMDACIERQLLVVPGTACSEQRHPLPPQLRRRERHSSTRRSIC